MTGRVIDDAVLALASATLTPGANSALFWDPLQGALDSLAATWGAMITNTLGVTTQVFVIGSSESDESLWGCWKPGRSSLRWDPGLLSNPDNLVPIYLIPNLVALELPVRRALLTLVDADVVHVQRHGQSLQWRPRGYWIAGCQRSEIGQVSPHLLDRFPIRLNLPNGRCESKDGRRREVQAGLAGRQRNERIGNDATFPAGLAEAFGRRPILSDAALDQIDRRIYSSDVGTRRVDIGMRRALGLTRLAVGVARLRKDSKEVGVADVDAAAELLGLEPHRPTAILEAKQKTDSPSEDESKKSAELILQQGADPQLATDGNAAPDAPSINVEHQQQLVVKPDAAQELENAGELKVPLPPSAFPEDTAAIQRESFSLRFSALPQGRKTFPRGTIIGSLPTTELRDLALTATLIEAAKFQKLRGNAPGSGRPLKISATDLRRHRRLPEPDCLLLLVIDYTAVGELPWQRALMPYLHEAYTHRAGITIVQVGAKETADPLRATLIRARNLLSPAVALALSATPGTATPLAHGLDLAAGAIRGNLHRGRDPNIKSTVVVMTDGWGNVPLQASLTGLVSGIVNREGVNNAVEAAGRFREINRLRCVVISPTLTVYRQIPEELAAAMNAKIAYLPPLYEVLAAGSSKDDPQ